MYPRILRTQLLKIMRFLLPCRILHQYSSSNLRFLYARMHQLSNSLFVPGLQSLSSYLEQLLMPSLLFSLEKILHNNRLRIFMPNRNVPESNDLSELLISVQNLHNNSFKLPHLCKWILPLKWHLRRPMSSKHNSPVNKWFPIMRIMFNRKLPTIAPHFHNNSIRQQLQLQCTNTVQPTCQHHG